MFHKNAWEDYQYFQEHDQKILEKINRLIKDIIRTPFDGIGKPESLKHTLSGFWSRRINQEHRLVYTVKNNDIYILQCRYHY
jgi:toxin YoeB